MADKRPVTLLTRPVGDYVGMYVTASLVPVRHFAIHALGFMWEFDQMGVVIYPCEDHHTDRRWACGHFVFTEWFMVGNCVVEEENLRNFVREWEAQNDYQHVVKNCQAFALDFGLYATGGRFLESPNFDSAVFTTTTEAGAMSHGTRNVVTMGTAKAQYAVAKVEAHAPSLSAIGKIDNGTASGYVNASVCEAKASVGPLKASVGLNVNTGGHIGAVGLGLSLLGFGIAIGPKKTGISFPFVSLMWEH